MEIKKLNSVLWSQHILALPEDEQVEAMMERILDARQDYDSFVFMSIVANVLLYQKLLASPELARQVFDRVFKELERRHWSIPENSEVDLKA